MKIQIGHIEGNVKEIAEAIQELRRIKHRITVTTDEGELLASIEGNDIVCAKGCKVEID